MIAKVRTAVGWRLRRARRVLDRPSQVRLLVASGALDLEYYQALTGLQFPDAAAAARHYLQAPASAGLSPHPLMEPAFVEPTGSAGIPFAVRYLTREKLYAKKSPHPAFDLKAARRVLGKGKGRQQGGPWLEWLRAAGPQTPVPTAPGRPVVTWGVLRQTLIEAAEQWRTTRAEPAAHGRARAELPGEAALAAAGFTADSPRPLVSIVVRTHDQGPALRALTTAALRQDYPRLELLVADAGSSDDTAAVLAGLAHFDPRIQAVGVDDADADARLAASGNAAIAVASGAWLIFFDGALAWRPELVSQLVATATASGARLLHAAVTQPGGGVVAADTGIAGLLSARCIDLGVTLVAAELLAEAGGFDPRTGSAADDDLLLRLAAIERPQLVRLIGGRRRKARPAPNPGDWARAQARHLLPQPGGADRLSPEEPSALSGPSVILPVAADLPSALRRLRFLAPEEFAGELVFVGLTHRWQYSCLRALGIDRPITVVSSPATSLALLYDLGAVAARGERLVFVPPRAELNQASVTQLVAGLDAPGTAVVQAIEENLDMTVRSAGGYFAPLAAVPARLLAGHAAGDAERLGDAVLPSVHAEVVAVRARDFWAVGGFDPGFADAYHEVELSRSLAAAGLGAARLVSAARVSIDPEHPDFPAEEAASARLLERLWPTPPAGSADCLAASGFVPIAHRAEALPGLTSGRRTQYRQVPLVRPTRSLAGARPTLRWAIDIAATPGRWGEAWGDRHFAYSLAASLRKLGQQVVVDHRGAGQRETRAFDDVVLTLRGQYEVMPAPGPLNLLWVISHPDDVSCEEAEAYDYAFAASQSWSQAHSQAWGIPIETMLQCTDTDLFHPGRAEPDSGAPVLFVGNTRHVSRAVVEYALHAQADLALYGTGWESTTAADRVLAPTVANSTVGELYAGAGVVLNDHWADMRVKGFISNRLFDAVACGARVLSDEVDGAAEIFGGSVQLFETPGDVARLLSEPFDQNWPSRAERLQIAGTVAREHSFDARAERLLARAIELLRARGTLPTPG